MEILASAGDVAVVALICEKDVFSFKIVSGETALRLCLDLEMMFEDEGAEGAEIHRSRSGIGVFVDQQAIDDPVDPMVVALRDQHDRSPLNLQYEHSRK